MDNLVDLRILIPVKALDQGKSRLAPLLDAPARRALCERFLRRTLELAKAVAPTVVITRDPAAAELVYGATVVAEPEGADLNAALDAGRRAVPEATRLLILPTDLPRLSRQTLTEIAAPRAQVVIVPDRHERGTNLLALPQGAVASFRFAFGEDSFHRHQAEAARLGIAIETRHLPDAAFDVDQPEDYAELEHRR